MLVSYVKRFFTGAILSIAATASIADSIFKIGEPDASAAEFFDFDTNFKKARFHIPYGENPYKIPHAYFSAPKVFDAQKDSAKDFPFVMPILKCQWADPNFKEKNPQEFYYTHELAYKGGKNVKFPPYRIKFNLDDAPKNPLYLKIGFADHAPVEIPSSMKVSANGDALETFKIGYEVAPQNPYPSFANILYNPKTWGIPVSHCVKIPAENLKAGENFIELEGVTGQKSKYLKSEWVAFDYIQLDDCDKMPEVKNPLVEESQKVRASLDFDKIVFAVRGSSIDTHWYGNFGRYAKISTGDKAKDNAFDKCTFPKSGGKLALIDIKSGEIKTILEDKTGGVRNPCVHFDGEKMLFSYRKGGEEHYNLYESDIDGKNIERLNISENGYDDIEPCYLPDDDIVFVSSRCKRIVPCWAVDVATLHRYFRDENIVRAISANIDQDNSPSPTSDGRIIYMKWEYVQKNQLNFHALWKKDTNGANDMVFFGNDIARNLLIDARQIGDSSNYVCTMSPEHGSREHMGAIARIDSPKNPADADAFKFVTGDDMFFFSTPVPIDENLIMATDQKRILILDKFGHIFSDIANVPADFLKFDGNAQLNLREPAPVVKRPRGRAMPDLADYDADEATVVLVDAAIGRNMEGVKQGDIKELLIVEVLPNATHVTGGMEPYTLGGTFSIERPLGKVKVESDGSAHFKVPANRALAFVALDKNGNAVKRMQSFTSFISGTTTSCIGCHENRDMAPPAIKNKLAALARPPENIMPIEGVGSDVIDFVRDIQPILDKYCIKCHNPIAYKGKLDLSDGMGGMFAKSYFNLRVRRQINDGLNRNGNQPPYTFGTGASALMNKIDGSHTGAKLSAQDVLKIKTWLDMGAIHAASCAAAESGMMGSYYNNSLLRRDQDWEERQAYCKVVAENCASCHKGDKFLPDFISGDPRERTPWHWLFYQGKDNVRNRLSHHAIFNVTHPENSAVLVAPLAQSAGGRAGKNSHKTIFDSQNDPRYRIILSYLNRARDYIENENPRYTSPNYKPSSAYLDAMTRYGIVRSDDDFTNFNAFECDKKYWKAVTNPAPYKYEK